ncbi:hypothetical protein TNCV_3357451 [Trichonephila clavipes]|nr:hypothetical protein TNCV_3357451 [Trichonephila clavipes]
MKECGPVVMRIYLRGYSQCQSDRSIDKTSIWFMRFSDVDDFSRDGLLSQRTDGVVTKTEETKCRCVELANPK